MSLSRERVHSDLAVDDECLINTRQSGTDHRYDQFTHYEGTCSDPIPLPAVHLTPTIARYWETNTRFQKKVEEAPLRTLLEMGVVEDLGKTISVTGASGWSVEVFQCQRHQGSLCTEVWRKGKQVGRDCLSTTSSPRDTVVRLGTVVDVGRGRIGFIDVNRGKVLHKFDVRFRSPVYPVFGVTPFPDEYEINMRLLSGGEITITKRKQRLISKALFSS